jgi:uncharacterized membrane protein YfcA
MTEALAEALARPGLAWLVLAAALAGLVRGFSGFGSGLVYMPIAGTVVPPAVAVALLTVMDLIGPIPNLPGAIRTGRPREVAVLGAGLVFGMPLGLWALFTVPPETFRWAVSLMGLATVAALVAGWRYRGPRGPRVTGTVGVLSGLVGGATGLPGPPVILYYMASPLPVAVVRANLMMFLVMVDVVMAGTLAAAGRLDAVTLVTGLGLLVPFSLANWLGSSLFDPERARAYRVLSWGLIAASALAGLPLWTGGWG